MADTQLYLGLDLGSEYTQLSYYNADTREPESVYHEEAKAIKKDFEKTMSEMDSNASDAENNA